MFQLLPLLLASTTISFQPIDFAVATTLSLDLSLQPNEEQSEDLMTESIASWGKKDTWRWNIQGGYAEDVKESDNTLAILGVEFDYFIDDNLSLDLGFFGMNVDQLGPNTRGFNFTLQLRWHFVVEDSWSMFLEGGAGLLRTGERVPASGSKFNFTPQAGFGFSFDAGNDIRWLLGLKWHHISNANTYSTNPGRDSIMVWTGISFPF
jgi:hypothetical protein